MMEQLLDDCPDLRRVIYLGEPQPLADSFESFDQVLESGKKQPAVPAAVHPDDTKYCSIPQVLQAIQNKCGTVITR